MNPLRAAALGLVLVSIAVWPLVDLPLWLLYRAGHPYAYYRVPAHR